MENCIALAAYLAAQTVENGGEISSAEETAIRVCKSGGAEDINVFIIPSMAFVCAKVGGKRQSDCGNFADNAGRCDCFCHRTRFCRGACRFRVIACEILLPACSAHSAFALF